MPVHLQEAFYGKEVVVADREMVENVGSAGPQQAMHGAGDASERGLAWACKNGHIYIKFLIFIWGHPLVLAARERKRAGPSSSCGQLHASGRH
jgi:hypothetical protein